MSTMTEYKCPSCGSTLAYIPDKGKLICSSCGNEYDLETMQAFNDSEDAHSKGFDWSSYRNDFKDNEHLDDTNIYICKSCGATIETDKSTAAMACPYCGNNVILDDKLKGGLKPNAIIPFKITSKELPEAVKKFYAKKKLLPRGFFDENKIGKIQGVYIPFWLYDCKINGNIMLNATRVRTYRQGDYDCTETSFYLLQRDGEMSFSRIPVDASEKADNDLMDSIEPFNYSELVDFDKAYLSGYLAERFDTDPDKEIDRATLRMKHSCEQEFKKTAPTYTTVSIKSSNVKVENASVKYALLPVYLLNCKYKDKEYRYAINGQTGKVVGELPISIGKTFAWFGGVAGCVFAAVFAILQLL